MTEKIETFLPGFGGFHGTRWENLFPFFRELCADRFAQEEAVDGLGAADFSAILRETSDASRFFASLATRFCRLYDADVSRRLGFELGLMFSEFDMPAVRGCTTDFILARARAAAPCAAPTSLGKRHDRGDCDEQHEHAARRAR